MTGTYYYIHPFGISADDLAAIPAEPPGDGSVSYLQGWTPPYEQDLIADPLTAIPIPRGQMNQLFLDITTNIQQYQQFGTPLFVTAAQNESVPLPYPIYARVYFNNLVYENQVAGNTHTPGTDDTWLLISAAATGVPVGTVLDFAGTVAPSGFFLCDGSQKSRTTYDKLINAITFTQNGTTTNTMNTLSGLTNATILMYVGMALEGAGIPTGTTVASIIDNNNITMSQNATASATVPVQFFPWGNGDGSTTFNIPVTARRVTMGAGSSASGVIGNVVGQNGGTETNTLAPNNLPATPPTLHIKGTTNLGAGIDINTGGFPQYDNRTDLGEPLGTATAFNIVQPANIMNRIIKF